MVVKPEALYQDVIKDTDLTFYSALVVLSAIVCAPLFLDILNKLRFTGNIRLQLSVSRSHAFGVMRVTAAKHGEVIEECKFSRLGV